MLAFVVPLRTTRGERDCQTQTSEHPAQTAPAVLAKKFLERTRHWWTYLFESADAW